MKTRFYSRLLAASSAVLWLSLMPGIARAQKVSADEKGDISYTDAAGHLTRLTSEGKDSDPALDPTGRRITFVHRVPGKMISSGSGDAQPTELCVMDTDGKNQEVLVHSAEGKKPEDILADFASPTWSPEVARSTSAARRGRSRGRSTPTT